MCPLLPVPSNTETQAVIFTVCIDAFLHYSLRYKSLEQSLHIEKERLRSCLEAAQEEKAKLMKVRKGAELCLISGLFHCVMVYSQ